ncbi:MAG: sulfotransferase [Alphaproteobacteria bacterium]|nr:sulfotransferase [Alphaproteobacteria bacterium]
MTALNAQAQIIQRAATAFQRGAWNEAAELCEQAIGQFGEDANSLMILGVIRFEGGDPAGAIDYLERARDLMPTHIHVLVNLGAAYRAVGRLHEARIALEAALQVDRRFAIAHNNLGNVLLDIGDRAAAKKEYERAVVAQPNYAEPIAGLARIAEEEHRLEDARRLSERALGLTPQNVSARLTRARVELRDGDASNAAAALENLLRDGSPTATNRVIGEGYLGEAYDKLGRFDEAFAAFSRANAIQFSQHKQAFENDRGPLSPDTVRRLDTFVAAADLASWREAPPASGITPVFLVGFPRSGTTLLDQILASHPGITTLEERDTLGNAVEALIRVGEGFDRWALLPTDEIERLRSLYWAQVTTGLLGAPIKGVFVDKLPLNAVFLPLIYRLFPKAKIILAIRDPRDVVLSCFQQRFGMNAAMFQLLTLDGAVTYYDAVMALVEASRAKLPLDIHMVKYESVVEDFDATVMQLLSYLGLDWDEAVRDYSATAKGREIGTPSAAQVVQPLYRSAQGKWQKYRSFLEPHLPMLAKWVETFGYRPS